MDSPDDGAATAGAPPPLRPALPTALPELSHPPALLSMQELEAVAAALPGKKRRLRETFERLAATSPDPLPFRWEDLDSYLSSFQYSFTLRSCQLQEPQLPVPVAAPVPAADPIATEDGVVEKGKKRKASSQAAAASRQGAHQEMRGVPDKDKAVAIKEACPLQDMAVNGTRLLCPAPLGCGNDTAEVHMSMDTTMPLDPVSKIAVVRPLEEFAQTMPLDPVSKIAVVQTEDSAPTRRPSNSAAGIVQQAGSPKPARRRPRPPCPVIPAPAVVSAPAFAGGDVEKAKKLSADRKLVKKKSVSGSHETEEAKVSTSPPADGVGNEALATTEADMQADRPVCKIKVSDHVVPAVTVTGGTATKTMPALALKDSGSVSVSVTPKPESCVQAADVDKNVVVAERRINNKVIETEDTRATLEEGKASPLQVQGQAAYEVSALPINSGNGMAEAGVDVGTAALAEVGRNTCVQQDSAAMTRAEPKLMPDNSPETAEPLQAKGPNAGHVLQQQHMPEVRSEPISQAEKQNNMILKNHGGRPTTGINFMRKAQGAFQRRTGINFLRKAQEGVQGRAKDPKLGKGGTGQDNGPASAKGSWALPNDCRNNDANGNGKLTVIEPSEYSKSSSMFCHKCGSKGHVTHKCRTAKHLVELYLKDKKEKLANKICYRCGTRGHMAVKCRTPKHLVDLYQKNRAAEKKAALLRASSVSQYYIY